MYIPDRFSETRINVLHELIRTNPFGTLCTHGKEGLDANHLPFELDVTQGEFGTLHAHVARANPVWQAIPDGPEVLVIFRGGDAYVSPSWYPSKHELHRQVPTWNYRVAHAFGTLRVRHDERYLRGVVARLTRHHEAAQPAPWKMTDSSPDFINGLLQRIVGIEITITRLVGKSKLSQDEEKRDIEGAGLALKSRGHQAVADAMLATNAKDGGAVP